MPKHDERQASPFSRRNILKHLFVEGQIRHQTLQALILFLELLQTPGVADVHAAELLSPSVERLRVDPKISGHLLGRNPAIKPLQCPDDLLFGEPALLHLSPRTSRSV